MAKEQLNRLFSHGLLWEAVVYHRLNAHADDFVNNPVIILKEFVHGGKNSLASQNQRSWLILRVPHFNPISARQVTENENVALPVAAFGSVDTKGLVISEYSDKNPEGLLVALILCDQLVTGFDPQLLGGVLGDLGHRCLEVVS